MKSVIFFLTGLDSGGLENYLLRFLQYKANGFDEIIVFCKGGKTGQLHAKYQSIKNVTIVARKIGFFSIKDFIFLFFFLLKRSHYSICDFTGNFAGLILFCAKIAGNKKRISFYRGASNHFSESNFKLLYNSFVKFLTYKFATDILSNSKAAFDFFYPNKWHKESRFKIIYNAVKYDDFIYETDDIRDEIRIPKDAFVIGHTGRYNKAKNHSTILAVAEELCKNDKSIYFVLCGNGVKDNLEKVVGEMNLLNQIILLNNRSDIPKVLNSFDCFYFPSLTEGQPNSLIEAMLMNLPIVASDIPSIKETVPKEYINHLIPPTNVKIAVEKIKYIQRNQSSIHINLKEWVIKNFAPEKLFNEFYKVI